MTHFRYFALLGCLLLPCAHAQSEAEVSAWSRFREKYNLRSSIQAGLEYDSNVFRTFGVNDADSLLRVLFKNQGSVPLSDNSRIGWSYQGGGKKFFNMTEQDLLIQLIEVPFTWAVHPRIVIRFQPEFRYQNERDALDTGGLDVNEDQWSTTSRLTTSLFLPQNFAGELFGEFTRFQFRTQETYSYFLERGGASLRRSFEHSLATGVQYSYTREQFLGGPREDRGHEPSVFFQYSGVPFISLRYAYEDSDSTLPELSFTNHRVTFVLSLPLGKKEEKETNSEEDPAALFAFLLLGTWQYKEFPSVFGSNEEGQRFLLTGAEDENFNSLIAKLTYHPFRSMAVEAKYTRYSNGLSSQQEDFKRSLYYGGIRFSF